MSKRRKTLFIFLFLTTMGLFIFFTQFPSRPEILVKRIANIDLPNSARLIKKEEEWSNFGGGGYSLVVYSLPSDFEKDLFSHCESMGYKYGNYRDMGTQIRLVDANIVNSGRSCYLLKISGSDIKISVINQERLIVYVQY